MQSKPPCSCYLGLFFPGFFNGSVSRIEPLSAKFFAYFPSRNFILPPLSFPLRLGELRWRTPDKVGRGRFFVLPFLTFFALSLYPYFGSTPLGCYSG